MKKSLPKIFITFFLTVFILQMICLILIFTLPQTSQASSADFKPQVGIGTDFETDTTYTPDGSTKMIGEYVRAIYKYTIGIVGVLAAVVLMFGGVKWIVAGGNATAIGEAKAWIGASLTGLLLALCSYLILATVNPALVDFRTTKIPQPKKIDLALLYTTSSYDSVFQDNTIACGVEQGTTADGKTICGTKCDSGSCQLTSGNTAGAKKCPTNVVGSDSGGEWWICSAMQGGGTSCCHTTEDCGSGYSCRPANSVELSTCDARVANPTGKCVANADATGGGTPEGGVCTLGGPEICATGLHCGNFAGAGRCVIPDWEIDGISPGDPCGSISTGPYKCTATSLPLVCPSGYSAFGPGGRGCEGAYLMCCRPNS